MLPRLLPFFHRGAPKNEMTIKVTRYPVVIGKDGKPFSKQPQVIRITRVTDWLGFSSPRRIKWFFGLMRMEELDKDGDPS